MGGRRYSCIYLLGRYDGWMIGGWRLMLMVWVFGGMMGWDGMVCIEISRIRGGGGLGLGLRRGLVS